MKNLSFSLAARSVFFMLAVFMTYGLVITTTGCKQEQIAPSVSSSKTTETLPTKFQIDGQEVAKEDFFKQLLPTNQVSARDVTSDMSAIADAYRVLGESGKLGEDKQIYDIVNVFTSDEEFYTYADENGRTNERTYDLVQNHLADYAVTSGAIDDFEATGIVPQSYIDYVDAYLVKNGFEASTPPALQVRTIFSQVYKGCNLTESSFPIRHNAWLGSLGYNNNISSFQPVGFIGGRSDIFDETFYRKRIAGLWYWSSPGTKFDFCSNPWGFLNNRASSWSIF